MTQPTLAHTAPSFSTEFNQQALPALEALDPAQSQHLAEYARIAFRGVVDLTTIHALGQAQGTPGERWLAQHQSTYSPIINAHKDAISDLVLAGMPGDTQPSYSGAADQTRINTYDTLASQVATDWEGRFQSSNVEYHRLCTIALGLTGIYGTIHRGVPADQLLDGEHYDQLQAAAQQYALTTLTPALTPATSV